MADKMTKEQRSYCMSRIGSKDTKIEIIIRKKLFSRGLRYRKNYKKLPGKPDIAFVKNKVAVFIDGDFWHGKDFNKRRGKYNEYWFNKISTNMKRDKKVTKELQSSGWKVIRIWGSDVQENPEIHVENIIKAVGNNA